MPMETVVVYGIGGYDPSKPNNNIVEQYEVEVTEQELEDQRILDLKESARAKLIAGEQLTEEEVNAILP